MAEPHTTAAAGSALLGAAIATAIGIPLPALMGALAGSALILSFLPARKDADGNPVGRLRTAGTVGFCTLGGSYGAPLAMAQLSELQGLHFLTALGLAALLQVAIPLLLDKRQAMADWLVGLLPGRKS